MDARNELIRIDERREGPPVKWVSLMTLVERFINAQDVSPSSRNTYLRQLKQFVRWLMQTGKLETINTLERESILEYKGFLLSAGKSSYTVDGYVTSVRKFFEWLEWERIYPNIAKGVKGTKKAKGFRKDCLTPQQIREALNSINRGTLEGLRNFALINLLARTGLRTIEVARAQIKDLRQEGLAAVLWIQGKARSGKDDFVLLVEESLKPLREYLSARGDISEEAPLFHSISDRNNGAALTTKSIRRIVKTIFRRVNLNDKRLSAHSLRHTAISLSIKGGASLEQAQAMARHTDPKTTLIYFHNVARLENGAERFIHF